VIFYAALVNGRSGAYAVCASFLDRLCDSQAILDRHSSYFIQSSSYGT